MMPRRGGWLAILVDVADLAEMFLVAGTAFPIGGDDIQAGVGPKRGGIAGFGNVDFADDDRRHGWTAAANLLQESGVNGKFVERRLKEPELLGFVAFEGDVVVKEEWPRYGS